MLPRPNRIIVAQYAPPQGTSLLAAAELLGDSRRAVAAQVIDLAVRGALAIAPLDERGSRPKGYELTLRSNRGLGADERELLEVLVPKGVGASRRLRRGRNPGLGKELRHPHRRAVARLIQRGQARERSWLERAVTPWRRQPVVPTEAAWPIVDHLWGIHDYISLAEKDRLNFLQSPDGAQLRHDPTMDARVLLLNERLLPFAVLFGLEKQWAQVLDTHYREVGGSALDLPLDALDGEWLLDSAAELPDLGIALDVSMVLEGVGQLIGGAFDVLGNLDL